MKREPVQMVCCGIGHEELTCTDGVVWCGIRHEELTCTDGVV